MNREEENPPVTQVWHPDSVDDVINGLKHMADDHPCCRAAIERAVVTLEAVKGHR